MGSSVVKNQFGAGSVVISDGTGGTALTTTVDFDNGDFSISGLKAEMKDTAVYQSRGVVHSVRHGARNFATFSFTGMMSEFSDSSGGSAIDMITGKAGTPFAARVSTLGASADVMTFQILFTAEGTDHGDSADHTITMNDCELAFDFSEGDPDSFSFSGTIYGSHVLA
tara:strand:- start:36 stop:539 length:504 start_codon:yes stop_codon:yes gene_type:complete